SRPPTSTLLPYTPLFRSLLGDRGDRRLLHRLRHRLEELRLPLGHAGVEGLECAPGHHRALRDRLSDQLPWRHVDVEDGYHEVEGLRLAVPPGPLHLPLLEAPAGRKERPGPCGGGDDLHRSG